MKVTRAPVVVGLALWMAFSYYFLEASLGSPIVAALAYMLGGWLMIVALALRRGRATWTQFAAVACALLLFSSGSAMATTPAPVLETGTDYMVFAEAVWYNPTTWDKKAVIGGSVVAGTGALCVGAVFTAGILAPACALAVGGQALGAGIDVAINQENSQLSQGVFALSNGDFSGAVGNMGMAGMPACGDWVDNSVAGESTGGGAKAFCALDAVAVGLPVGKVAQGGKALVAGSGKALTASVSNAGDVARIGGTFDKAGRHALLNTIDVAPKGLSVAKQNQLLRGAGLLDDAGQATAQGVKALGKTAGVTPKLSNMGKLTQAGFKPSAAYTPVAKNSLRPAGGFLNQARKTVTPTRTIKAPFSAVGRGLGMSDDIGRVGTFALRGANVSRAGYVTVDRFNSEGIEVTGPDGGPIGTRGEAALFLDFINDWCSGSIEETPPFDYNHALGTMHVTEQDIPDCSDESLALVTGYLTCLRDSDPLVYEDPVSDPECQAIIDQGVVDVDPPVGEGEAPPPTGKTLYDMCISSGFSETRCANASSQEGDFWVSLAEMLGIKIGPEFQHRGTYDGGWDGVNQKVYWHDVGFHPSKRAVCDSGALAKFLEVVGSCGYTYLVAHLRVAVEVDGVLQLDESYTREELVDLGLLDIESETGLVGVPAVIMDSTEAREVKVALSLGYYHAGSKKTADGEQAGVVFTDRLYEQQYASSYQTTAAEGGDSSDDQDATVQPADPESRACKEAGGNECGGVTGLDVKQRTKDALGGIGGILKYWWVALILVAFIAVYRNGMLWRWSKGGIGKKPKGTLDIHKKPSLGDRLRKLITGKDPEAKLKPEFRSEGVPLILPANKEGTGPSYEELKRRLEEDDG